MATSQDQQQDLYALFTAAKSKKEMADLLEDILTPQELESLAERWQIVQRLAEGKTQRKIAEELGISVAKVTRGARAIKYGTGAFPKFVKRLKAER